MYKIPKKSYTLEFKQAALKQLESGKRLSQVAKELGITEQTLSYWRKSAAEGKLIAGKGQEITPEQMELSRLRADNARLKMELEIVKKAAAYFAKESL